MPTTQGKDREDTGMEKANPAAKRELRHSPLRYYCAISEDPKPRHHTGVLVHIATPALGRLNWKDGMFETSVG